MNAGKNHGTHRLRIRLSLPLRERSSSFNNSKDREMCIINNLSSVNERRKNLRGEEKGERERERVGEVWILFRGRGRKRWWREGYKGRNQKRAQHAFISSKVKTTCFSFF